VNLSFLVGRFINMHFQNKSEIEYLVLQSIDVKVQNALECSCLDGWKKGPCGSPFIDAFSCYLKSTKEENV
jgi:hypothetical protein